MFSKTGFWFIQCSVRQGSGLSSVWFRKDSGLFSVQCRQVSGLFSVQCTQVSGLFSVWFRKDYGYSGSSLDRVLVYYGFALKGFWFIQCPV